MADAVLAKDFDVLVNPACSMDDLTFLRQFEDGTFPFEQWKHRQHVKAAYLYLSRLPLGQAVDRMRTSIQAFNAANPRPDAGPTTGYHETLTQAWMRVIHATIRCHGPCKDSDGFCDEHPHLTQRTLLRLYYSHDRILSPEAKTRFVEPDLAPLPAE